MFATHCTKQVYRQFCLTSLCHIKKDDERRPPTLSRLRTSTKVSQQYVTATKCVNTKYAVWCHLLFKSHLKHTGAIALTFLHSSACHHSELSFLYIGHLLVLSRENALCMHFISVVLGTPHMIKAMPSRLSSYILDLQE